MTASAESTRAGGDERDRRFLETIAENRASLEALAASDFECADYAEALLAWAENHGEGSVGPHDPAVARGGDSDG